MVRKKGFTLIELLVVIAIIALLLSVIAPALKKAKEQARNMVCQSNVRSLAIATRAYAEENDWKIFAYMSGLYLNQLAPYIADVDQVRACPSTQVIKRYLDGALIYRGTSKFVWWWDAGTPEPEYGSYGLSGWLYDYSDPKTILLWEFVGKTEVEQYAYRTLSEVKNAGATPIFFDCIWVDAWPKHTDTIRPSFNLDEGDWGTDRPVNQHIQRLIIERHKGTINLCFLDGHGGKVKLQDLWSLKWHKKFEPKYDMKRTDGTAIYK